MTITIMDIKIKYFKTCSDHFKMVIIEIKRGKVYYYDYEKINIRHVYSLLFFFIFENFVLLILFYYYLLVNYFLNILSKRIILNSKKRNANIINN